MIPSDPSRKDADYEKVLFKIDPQVPVCRSDPDAGIFPLVFETNGEGVVEDIIDHTFKDSIHSVHRGLAGLVEFGFTYKF